MTDLAMAQEDRQRLMGAYRTLATDEFGEDLIHPQGDVVATFQGAFVECRDGRYVRVYAVPSKGD